MEQQLQPNRNKKAAFGWAMYDWANSVYSLVITTAIFPIYFHAMAKQVATKVTVDQYGVENAFVPFAGFEVKSISLQAWGIAIAYLVISLISPLLSGIADYSGRKKRYMIFFTIVGSLSCAAMFFFEADTFYLGFWLFTLAAVGYAGGVIFNDAFLPEVAPPDKHDRLSARGYALGYIGSVLLLVVNLVMIQAPSLFFDVTAKQEALMVADPLLSSAGALEAAESYFAGVASRISFLMVGIWWLGFAQITFFSLKETRPGKKSKKLLRKGFEELKKVYHRLRTYKILKRYLLAFFFYNMGLQTVMYMASGFGTVELKMTAGELIISVLLIQLIAIPGAYLFALLSRKLGNFSALLIGIGTWGAVCIGAFFVRDATGFYILGAVVGLIMGGMQALSRSTYSKLIPQTEDNASFFSFFQIVDKIAVITGMLSFGLISQLIGTRNAVLVLILFFVLGAGIIYALSKIKDLKYVQPE